MRKIQQTFKNSVLAAPWFRELGIILVFVVITLVMTWPWVLHLRDAVSDPGDPYLNAWIMWWDYYQTFHDPIHLFQAPIFYPYSYTLAYSEHNYGIAMLFFPFYAMGLRPLTAAGLATLAGFVISGYGAFRLARTLTGRTGMAWVAGITFGFALYRFASISHLNYLFAGWIPLTLEALVLFIRRPTRRRAVWLGVAFTMNALTCIHWFVLTLIPFSLSGAILLTREQRWTMRQLWIRLATALAISALILLPFLLPYQRVAKLQGTIRTKADAATYSAYVRDWAAAPPMSKLWRGFGPVPDTGERHLFPGLVFIVLLSSAFFIARSRKEGTDSPTRTNRIIDANVVSATRATDFLFLLDGLAIASMIAALLAYGYGGIRPFGLKQLDIPDASRALAFFTIVVIARLCIAYPRAINFTRNCNLIQTLRNTNETLTIGVLWSVLGFFGSLGMHFFFHRILFESIFLFRSIRVPARWAMIAILGASLLAAIGARKISDALQSRQRQIPSAAIYAVVCCLFLAEVWVAPIGLWRGEVDPDPVTKYLAQTSMRGGIAHLPSGTPGINQRYVLRQADHLKPLITAFSGFVTPQLKEYETLSQQRPISDRFFDLLEQIPASYLVVHDSTISPDARAATREMLIRGVTIGRLRFIREFEGTGINGNDGAQLFAVSKIEPAAQSEGPTPFYLQIHDLGAEVKNDPTLLVSAFDNWDFPLYLLYKLSYGRMPRYEEFMPDAETTGRDTLLFRANWHQHLRDNLRAFSEAWTNRPAFRKIYVAKSNAEFVNQLYANVSITPDEAERDSLVTGLNQGSETKASVLFKLTGNTALRNQERNKALVLAYYFGYLRRNPDDPPDNNLAGFNFWQEELDKSGDPARVTRAFMLSGEYEGIKRKGSK